MHTAQPVTVQRAATAPAAKETSRSDARARARRAAWGLASNECTAIGVGVTAAYVPGAIRGARGFLRLCYSTSAYTTESYNGAANRRAAAADRLMAGRSVRHEHKRHRLHVLTNFALKL